MKDMAKLKYLFPFFLILATGKLVSAPSDKNDKTKDRANEIGSSDHEPSKYINDQEVVKEHHNENKDERDSPAEKPADKENNKNGLAAKHLTNEANESTLSSSLNDSQFRYLGAFAISDALNATLIENRLSATKKYIVNNDSCFTHYDTLHNFTLWIDPYVFQPDYKRSENDFSLTTNGVVLGGEMTFINSVIMGGAIGYYFSNLNWVKKVLETTHIHAFHLGPYLSYAFNPGYLTLSVFWVKNFYNGKIKLSSKEKKDINHTSWDRVVCLEGGYDFEVSSPTSLHLYPYLKLYYVNVSETKYDLPVEITAKKRDTSFFRLDLATKIAKTIAFNKCNTLFPSFQIGWTYFNQTSNEELVLKKDKKKTPINLNETHFNQLLIGGEILIAHNQSFLIALEHDAYLWIKCIDTSRKNKV